MCDNNRDTKDIKKKKKKTLESSSILIKKKKIKNIYCFIFENQRRLKSYIVYNVNNCEY